MHADPLTNHWERARTLLRVKWGRLNAADVAAIDGRSSELAARLQMRYGYGTEQARTESQTFVQEFEQSGETSTEPREAALGAPAAKVEAADEAGAAAAGNSDSPHRGKSEAPLETDHA